MVAVKVFIKSMKGNQMDTSTLTLFIACLAFTVVNFAANYQVKRTQWLKFLTLVLGLAGIAGAAYILAAAFLKII
jgi:hypothetical protein